MMGGERGSRIQAARRGPMEEWKLCCNRESNLEQQVRRRGIMTPYSSPLSLQSITLLLNEQVIVSFHISSHV